ncbi:MAG: hypothetical protein JWO51_132 [Rhodospirillales bacterium]|nr:hypothetical protein [Rhodospirillales bacterium]
MTGANTAAASVAVPGEHEQRLTISIDVFVPDHPDRTTTPIFAATRRKLISNNPDACCWVCGKTEAELGQPLELHHDLVEWCDSLGVAWEKVKIDAPDFDWASFDPSKPETFIDSEHNAYLVLCKKHHTGKDHGKHMLPEPIWRMQRYKRDDFVFSPDEAAAVATAALSAGS